MIVPMALVVPAVLVFLPPAMVFAPASFPGFLQLISFVLRLPAMASMMFDRLVQVVSRMLNAPLALLVDFLRRLRKGPRLPAAGAISAAPIPQRQHPQPDRAVALSNKIDTQSSNKVIWPCTRRIDAGSPQCVFNTLVGESDFDDSMVGGNLWVGLDRARPQD